MAPGVAYLVTDMLGDAVNEGTGTAVRDAGLRGPVAGKTGTTNDGTDAWFVGYTPQLVGSVWIGFDTPRPIVRNATGGELAAPVWGRLMRRVLHGRAPGDWDEPASVVTEKVDPATGLVLRKGCRPAHGAPDTELFLRDMTPAASCPKGESAEGMGFFGRAAAWIAEAWADTRDWVVGLFRHRPPRPAPRPTDRYLGAPRLPPQGQPPAPEITVPDFRDRPVVPVLPESATTITPGVEAPPSPPGATPAPPGTVSPGATPAPGGAVSPGATPFPGVTPTPRGTVTPGGTAVPGARQAPGDTTPPARDTGRGG